MDSMEHRRPAVRRRLTLVVVAVPALAWAATSVPEQPAGGQTPRSAAVRGIVQSAGRAAPGAMITVRSTGAPISHSVVANAAGEFDFGRLPAGAYTASATRAAASGAAGDFEVDGQLVELEIELRPRLVEHSEWSAAAFLGLLPDGAEKRRFILDCTGCHVFDARIALPGGVPRTRDAWIEAVQRMLGFAGPSSSFPVIAGGREPAATADYLTRHLGDGAAGRLAPLPTADPATANAIVTEYDIPEPGDLPHDVAVLADGRILITGMFTHRMYVLDPETGRFDTTPIPVGNANPRAVELDERGNWFVLLGGPGRIARYAPSTGEWQSWSIGLYGHSIGMDRAGRAWFNGHFSRSPEVLGYADPATGEVKRYEVPAHPEASVGAGPIPYELRVAPDGRVWISELVGNRVIALDPHTEEFDVHTMPTPHSGPRRLDIAPDGTVWIPEYANNALARLTPGTGGMREYPLPIPDAAPYIARVDPANGRVWLATGAADALLSFDPATERFTVYRLPTQGALVRHIDIAPNGDVWAAYGASPGIPSKVARLRVR